MPQDCATATFQGGPDQLPTCKRKAKRSARRLNRDVVEKLVPVLTIPEIARLQGVHPTTVMRYIKDYEIDTSIKDLQADIGRDFLLTSRKAMDVKNRMLDHFRDMGETEISALPASAKTALINSATISAGTDYDKYRLEQNLSTSNLVFTLDTGVRRPDLDSVTDVSQSALPPSGDSE